MTIERNILEILSGQLSLHSEMEAGVLDSKFF